MTKSHCARQYLKLKNFSLFSSHLDSLPGFDELGFECGCVGGADVPVRVRLGRQRVRDGRLEHLALTRHRTLTLVVLLSKIFC